MLRLTIQGNGEGDLRQAADASLVEDDGLETVVTISLHTDAKATTEELLQYKRTQRGYWADVYDDPAAELNTGSKLWLLEGAKLTDEVMARAKTYADEALAWMVAEGAASKVETTISRLGHDAISGITQITIPGDPRSPYIMTWERHFAVR